MRRPRALISGVKIYTFRANHAVARRAADAMEQRVPLA
jgi:hypothetical protein